MKPAPARIMLCDDAQDFVRLLKLLLDMEPDLEVIGEAHDGEQAIRACTELQPDVLVLDVSMPVMDGLTALPAIRQVSPHTKVIMFSGFGSSQMKQKALDLGAVEYIEKGLPPAELAPRIRVHLPSTVDLAT